MAFGKEEKKLKMAKEAATAEFNRICDHFGFSISTEVKERVITMNVNNIDMMTRQEIADADAFIAKIMEGKICFDENSKQIVYKLPEPIFTGEDKSIKTDEFRFGRFTRAMQMMSGVPLNQCNFGTMSDEDQNKLLMAMTGTSDQSIFNNLSIPSFNDLRMVAQYFFG